MQRQVTDRWCVKALWLVWLGIFSGCSYNESDVPPNEEPVIPVTTMSIASLKTRYTDKPLWLVGESRMVISGVVTTTDKENNFYRSFFLEDETGAVEIRAGLYDLHNSYPLGRWVSVVADSLTLGVSDGIFQLGLASDRYPTEYMEHRVVTDQHLFCQTHSEQFIPRRIVPSQLREEWIGTLVRCDGILLADGVDTTWAIGRHQVPDGEPQTGILKFRGAAPSDSIYVSTSGYAAFADESVPTQRVTITGILLRGNVEGKTVYQLKMRNLKDVEVL